MWRAGGELHQAQIELVRGHQPDHHPTGNWKLQLKTPRSVGVIVPSKPLEVSVELAQEGDIIRCIDVEG
jgi:hypothetical protein